MNAYARFGFFASLLCVSHGCDADSKREPYVELPTGFVSGLDFLIADVLQKISPVPTEKMRKFPTLKKGRLARNRIDGGKGILIEFEKLKIYGEDSIGIPVLIGFSSEDIETWEYWLRRRDDR